MSDPDRDDPRDAWLSQALRHAPDADATPPAALSESILAKARAAAAPVQRPRSRPPSFARGGSRSPGRRWRPASRA